MIRDVSDWVLSHGEPGPSWYIDDASEKFGDGIRLRRLIAKSHKNGPVWDSVRVIHDDEAIDDRRKNAKLGETANKPPTNVVIRYVVPTEPHAVSYSRYCDLGALERDVVKRHVVSERSRVVDPFSRQLP